jgi:hypothetical protein
MLFGGGAHSMIGDARHDAATNAALAPVVDRFLPGGFEKLPEAAFGERYKHANTAIPTEHLARHFRLGHWRGVC